MPGERPPAATRSNLMRLRRRLGQLQRGVALLDKKREALVRELFGQAQHALGAQREIEARAREAYAALYAALAERGPSAVVPLGWPSRELRVELREFTLWGLQGAALASVPRLARSLAARGVQPGAGEASAALAAERFERYLEALLAAAPRDALLRRLGEALAQTNRLANTLERRLAVRVGAQILATRRTLDEREREGQLRLKRLVARRGAPV